MMSGGWELSRGVTENREVSCIEHKGKQGKLLINHSVILAPLWWGKNLLRDEAIRHSDPARGGGRIPSGSKGDPSSAEEADSG